MIRKKKDKSKAIKEIKSNVVQRQEWAATFNAIAAFGLSVVSICMAFTQGIYEQSLWRFVFLTVVFSFVGFFSIMLYLLNMANVRKYQED